MSGHRYVACKKLPPEYLKSAPALGTVDSDGRVSEQTNVSCMLPPFMPGRAEYGDRHILL